MDKHGIAFLLKYLYENTDQDNPVTSGQLQSILAEKGYASNPRTIRKDAGLLADADFDVVIIEQPGLPTQYYYNSRDFELTEARVLIDAVSSAQFITQKQTDELIEKLSVLAGRQHKAALKPQLYVSEHIKAENDQLLLTIEKIHQSILGRKKIAFRMFNYDTNMKKNFRHGGEVYTISPYNTVWNDDRYYVVGYSDKRQDIVSMRIDRMAIPEILDEDAFPPPENYNVQDYTDTVSRMYGGSREEVTLRCCTAMIDQVIDKFGKKVRLSRINPYTFDATATVAVSGTFLAWVFQFAGQITILSPEPVREMYAEMLRTAMAGMENTAICGFKESGNLEWKL